MTQTIKLTGRFRNKHETMYVLIICENALLYGIPVNFSYFLFRHLLAFIFIPLIQKEMDVFRETIWNSHRVRCQKDAQMPKGIPSHLYAFPEKYNAVDCGMYILL